MVKLCRRSNNSLIHKHVLPLVIKMTENNQNRPCTSYCLESCFSARLKKFKDETHDKTWTFYWINHNQPSLSDGFNVYNHSEVRGTAIYFYRDTGLGRQERCQITYDEVTDSIQVIRKINSTQFYYDDWELDAIYDAKKIE